MPGIIGSGFISVETTDVTLTELANVQVEFVDTGSETIVKTVHTDENGRALVELPGGTTYEIIARKSGFESFISSVSLAAGQTEHENMFLAAKLRAVLDVSSGTAKTGEQLSFGASGSIGRIDSYEWDLGDGRTASGQTLTTSYDTTGEYTVTLTVTDGDREDTTTSEVAIVAEDDLDFSSRPAQPVVGQTATFEGTGGDSYSWDFDDGTAATGQQVTHSYGTAGDYSVTLSTGNKTVTRMVSVQSADLEIADIERDIGGTLLPHLGIEESVEATIDVSGSQEIDRVEFEFGGQQVTAVSPPYSMSVTIDTIEPPATSLTVEAITTDGARQSFETEVPIQRLPDWLEFLLVSADTLGVERTGEGIEIAYSPLSNLDVGIDIPNDLLGGDDGPSENGNGDYDFGVAMGGIYDPRTNEAALTAAGNIAAKVLALAFEVRVALTGSVESTTLELQSARADIESQLSFDIEPPTVPVPISIPIPGTDSAIGIVPTIVVSADGTFNFDADLSFDTGTVEPGIALEVSIGITLDLPSLPDGELKGVPSGGIDGEFDVGTDDWDLQATFFLAGKVVLDPPGLPGVTLEQDPIWDQPLTGGSTQQVTATTPSGTRVNHTSTGGPQPLPEIDSVDSVSVDTDSISPRESFRLTDRPYEDIEPVLASPTDSKQVVVWGQQDETKSADAGHDLVGRWYENGTWSETFAITDDTYADASPVCTATDSGEILLVWKRLPEDLTASGEQLDTLAEVNDTRDKTEIAYSIYDGSSWSDPTLLTNTTVTQRRPTIAPAGGKWHVAWESFDRGAGSTTVRSTVISPDGTTTSISEWSGVANPDLGRRSDATVDLAYLVLDGGQVTDVTHEIRDGTSTTADRTYSASGADTVAVSNGRVIWATSVNRNPTLVEGTDGTTTELALRDDVAELRELSFSSRSNEGILSYVSTLEGNATRDQVYRLDRGNGWVFDRRITENIAEGLRVRYTDLVFAGTASFLSAYSVRDTGTDPVSDVFATLQEFGPAYALDGSVGSGVAGEDTTLSYTLANRGDVGGSDQVTVTVRRDGTEIDSVTHDPLGSGGTLSRSRTVTIGDGGEFELQLDVPEPSLETEPHSVALIAGRAQLGVDSVAAERTGPTEATVTVTVTNSGGAVAENVPVALADAAGTVATPTLDRIEPGTTTTVGAVVDPTTLDNSETHTVRLDPEKTLPPQAETSPLGQTYLVRPDLRIETVRYREDEDRFVRVLVSNHGPGEGVATLVLRDGTDTELASTGLFLPPAETETGSPVPAHRTVDVQVPTLATGQTVAVETEPAVSNLQQDALTSVETVETILPEEYSGNAGELAVSASDETIPVGGEAAVSISADNVEQLTVENLWTDWTVDVDVPGEIVDDAVGTDGTVTLTWQSTKSTVSPTVTVSVPNRYVGGTYELTLTATNANGITETTSTVVIE